MARTNNTYDTEHRRARKAWVPTVASGTVSCARCALLIAPGEPWHLDHTDDRAGYLGPSHAACNERAASVAGGRARALMYGTRKHRGEAHPGRVV